METSDLTVKQLANYYRQWLNDFLTIGAYADYLGIEDDAAQNIVELGRKAHELGY